MGKKLITVDGIILCSHAGKVSLSAQQTWVTIESRPVLVDDDPEAKTIVGCPVSPPNKLCTRTLKAEDYSSFLTIDGHAIALDTVNGSTDGTLFPAKYRVAAPGQTFVEEEP